MLCVAHTLHADDAARFRMQRELQYDARLDEVQCALLCPLCSLLCLAGRWRMLASHSWQLIASFNNLLAYSAHCCLVALLFCCLQTAMRTEPVGLDRHCRRYWWLYCDPGFLFVEEPDGQRIGVITSKEQLDEVCAGLAGPWLLCWVLGPVGGRQERWHSCGGAGRGGGFRAWLVTGGKDRQ
jgi:hypothetical protein